MSSSQPESIHQSSSSEKRRLWFPVAFGLLATISMAMLYTAILTLAQGWDHAVDLFSTDWPFILPITIGFGTQVGLFIYVRSMINARQRVAANAVVSTSAGTSAGSMLACCVHHLTDFLPVIGLTGAVAVLAEYRVPFMLFGIATNALGIMVMVRLLRKLRLESRTAHLH